MTDIVVKDPIAMLKQKRKKKVILLAMVGVLLMGSGGYAYQAMTTNNNVRQAMQMVSVERGNVTETVSASGAVQASKRLSLDFKSSGSTGAVLTAVHVEVGDQVKKGQVLAVLDDSEIKIKVSNAEASLLTAKAKWSEAQRKATNDELAIQEANVKKALLTLNDVKNSFNTKQALDQKEKAEMDLEDAQKEYEDQKFLFDAGAVSQSELNAAKQNLNKAQSDYNSALLQYNQTVAQTKKALQEAEISYELAQAQLRQLKAPPEASTLQAAQASVQQAEAELQQRKLDLNSLQMVAPMDGVIVEVNGDLGAVPENPFIVMDNSNSKQLEVMAQVSQSDIGKIKTGMKATFSTTSFENKKFEGLVTKIYPEAKTDSGVTTYQVLLSVDNKDGMLITGMSLSVTIEIGTHQNVLFIPASALQEQNGKDGVFIKSSNATGQENTNGNNEQQRSLPYSFQPVEIGYYTSDRVEITSGLQEGDQLVIPIQNAAPSSSNANNPKRTNSLGGGFSGGGMPGMGRMGGTR